MKTLYYFKKLMLGISFLFLYSAALFAQTDITIGTGSYTGKHLPIEPYYGYTYSQQIYLASEINNVGTITHIKFYFSGTSLSNSNNWTIYIGTTSSASFSTTSSWIPLSNLTQVYSATFTSPTTSGWIDFDITDFVYNGTDNLVIAVDENKPQYNGSADDFYCTLKSSGRAIYYYSDATNPNPASPPNGSLSSYIPNVKLTIVPLFANDLSMVEWINPSTYIAPNSSVPITIKIKNYGTASQSNFPVKYSIDAGATIVTETCTSNIAPGATLNYTFTTTANMSAQGIYECGAVVALSGDANHFNDTVFADINVYNPLAGTYTIGAASSNDYTTITDAVNDLYHKGVSAPVTFNIAAGTYNEQIDFIGAIYGTSPVNTITFKGQGNNTIVNATTSSAKQDVFYFENTSNITIDSLKITSSGYYQWGVRVNNSDSITIKNTVINLPITTSSYKGGILTSGSRTTHSQTTANYLTLEDNIISGGYYSIKLYGLNNSPSEHISIKRNTITNFHYFGIFSSNQNYIDYENNNLTSDPNNYGYGYYIYKNHYVNKIANNIITMNTTTYGYAIYLYNVSGISTTNPAMIYNNMISLPTATSSCIGIYSQYVANTSFYYNSVNIENGSSNSKAFFYNDSYNTSTINVKDNIFVNNGAGYSVYFNYGAPTTCDYNDLISNGAYLAYNSSNITDLTAWKNSNNNPGTHSVSIDPGFASPTDLHASSFILKSKGTAIPLIPYDIDGDVRNVNTPDMGADEFVPTPNDVYLSEIIPINGCGLSSSEHIQVIVKNYGSAAQTNIPMKLIIDGGPVITESKSTLALNAVDTFTFATAVDLSAVGYHDIIAYADLANDANRSNDTAFLNLDNILAISNFPYLEDFEGTINELSANFGSEAHVHLSARAANGGNWGVLLTGKTFTGWSATPTTPTQAFQYLTHFSELYSCNVNATSLPFLSMDFDYKINATFNTNYAWFRVMINDSVYVKDIYGDSVWQAPSTGNSMAFQNLSFHLNKYAGSQFRLSFEAVCKYDSTNYASHPWGDEVMLDNIHIFEPLSNDLSVTSLLNPISGICNDSNALAIVVIENKGALSQNNIPVNIVLSTPTGSDTIIGTSGVIPAFGLDTIYISNVNISQFAVYNVTAYADFAADQDHANDTLHTSFQIYTPFAVDYIENFDNNPLYWGATPTGWYVGNTHSKSGRGLYKYFNSSNTNGEAYMTRKIGPIPTDAVLTFDYRILETYNYPNSATSLADDSILFMISTDCGTSFIPLYIVDSTNHTPTTNWRHIQVDMSAYVGQNVIIKEKVIFKSGSYYVDVDDFGIGVPPPVDLGPDTAICIGVPITLDAGSGTSGFPYIWTYGLGSTADTIAYTQTISPDSAGIYVIKIQNTLLNNYDTIVITTNPLPTISSIRYDTICYNDSASVILNLTGTAPWNYTIHANSQIYYDTTSFSVTQRFAKPAVTTLYTIVSLTDGNGCTSTGALDSLEVFVNPLPTVSFTASLNALCESAPAYTLTGGLPANGVYTGNGVSGSTFTPSAAGAGSHIITYKYTDANGCSDSAWQTQVVNALPTVTLSSMNAICADAADITLNGGSPANGTYSGNGVNGGVFYVSTAGAGSHTITYSYTDGNGCTDSASQVQVVNALPTVSFATLADVCANNSDFSLSGGSPANGIYSGTGVSSGIFSPATAGVGSHTLKYKYTDTNGCSDSAMQVQTVNAVPVVTFNTSLGDLCADAPSYTLTGGLPANGTYSGTGVSSGSFSPVIAGAGLYTITYTFSDANGCTDSASQTQLVNPLPVVSLTSLPAICADAPDFSLSGGSPANGTYTGTGVSNGIFHVSTAGTGNHIITYTYVDGNSCSSSASQTQVVNALPSVSFATLADVCANDPDFALTGGTPVNGTYSGTGVSSGSFSPSNAGAGSHTLKYKFTDGNGCSDSAMQVQTVNAVPVVTFTTTLADLCIDAPAYTLTGGLPANGTYSGTGVSSGSFLAATAGAGSHIITYTFSDANGCTDSASQTQLVNPLPVVNMPSLPAVCIDAADFSLSGGTPANGTYSGTGVNSGTFYVSTAGVGAHTITYTFTDGNSCTNTDSSIQVVNALPTVSFSGLGATYCTNSLDDTLLANPLGGTFAGTGMNGNIFSPSASGAGNFDISYSYTDSNGCSNADTNATIVYNTPNVYLGADTTICANDSMLLDAGANMTSYVWNTGENTQSIYADSSDFGIGTFLYAVTIADANNCSNSDSIQITFEALPISQLLDTSTICGEDKTLLLDAGANPIYNYLWSTGATTNSISVDTATIGGTSKYVSVVLSSPAGCTTHDSSFVYFREVPMPFIGNDTSICWNHTFVLDAGAGYTSYLWNTGATTQSITLDSLMFNLGSNVYSVEVVNAVNCSNSDTITLVVDPCTGLYTQELSYEDIRVYPNPSKGRFRIDITGLVSDDYTIEIFNSMGSKVAGKKLESNGDPLQTWHVDLSTYAKGVYFVRLQSAKKIKVKRIVIQ